MPSYEYKCSCGKKALIEKPMSMASQSERCSCGVTMKRVYHASHINWNHWVPDYRQMDGTKEAIAAGMDE
jgi:predicted nucleic acid-binding Zn ribbon protein